MNDSMLERGKGVSLGKIYEDPSLPNKEA